MDSTASKTRQSILSVIDYVTSVVSVSNFILFIACNSNIQPVIGFKEYVLIVFYNDLIDLLK